MFKVQDVMQEMIMEAKKVNPARTSPWAEKDSPHLPTEAYVRSFLKRHRLSFRSTMSIHKGKKESKLNPSLKILEVTKCHSSFI